METDPYLMETDPYLTETEPYLMETDTYLMETEPCLMETEPVSAVSANLNHLRRYQQDKFFHRRCRFSTGV